jgi:glycosyltransferase involved in cell wall biosynthesis
MTWLSVIVPTYNGAAYLGAALESIAAQTDPGVEVIAVDDGSTDHTTKIVASFAGRLNIELIHRRAGSWVANTNLALERARGEWACFLHQDDLWRPGRLTAVRLALSSRPALLLTAAEFITAAGRKVGVWRCPLAAINESVAVAERLLVQNFVPLPGAVFRRSDALAVGGLDTELWYTADWDFWLRLAARGMVRYLSRPLAAFRLHPESQTVKRSGGIADFRQQHEIVFERHWLTWRDRLPDPKKVAAAARLSTEVNVLLAGLLHRERPPGRAAFAAAANAGWDGAKHFVTSSRIVERASARIRAGIRY